MLHHKIRGGRFFSRSGGEFHESYMNFPLNFCQNNKIHVKIIKNRLRSTMLDDWFSALTILASECDLVDGLNTDEISDRFALLSDKLQKYLSC